MTDYAIDAKGVRKTYRAHSGQPPKVALHGVDLRVPVGSVYGLLGPNGAGKSTFINILAGLVIKSAGSVRIWGFDQDENPRMSRASIGVVPQELNIDPFLSPLESLEVQAGLYGVRPEHRRSRALLEALGLADKAGAYARTLSGGMRRRLLVAKAMVHHPPVLVLDEPTAGVDVELRRQLWEFVRGLNAQGVTIILTTHYLEEAQEMCDRIAILDKGDVAAEGATADLLASLDRKSAKIRLTAPLADAAALSPPDQRVSWRWLDAERCELVVDFPGRSLGLGPVLAALATAGAEIADISTSEPDLEDLFLEITGGAPSAPPTASPPQESPAQEAPAEAAGTSDA